MYCMFILHFVDYVLALTLLLTCSTTNKLGIRWKCSYTLDPLVAMRLYYSPLFLHECASLISLPFTMGVISHVVFCVWHRLRHDVLKQRLCRSEASCGVSSTHLYKTDFLHGVCVTWRSANTVRTRRTPLPQVSRDTLVRVAHAPGRAHRYSDSHLTAWWFCLMT